MRQANCLEVEVTYLERQVTYLVRQANCLEVEVTYLEVEVTYLVRQVTYLVRQVTYLVRQVTYLERQVPCLLIQVTYLVKGLDCPPGEHAMSDDPIATLIRDLDAHGAPTLPWVMRWSFAGEEPFAAAWRASSDPIAMLRAWRMIAAGDRLSLRNALESALTSLPRIPGTRGAAHRNDVRRQTALLFARLWTDAGPTHLIQLERSLERWPIAVATLCAALHRAGPPCSVEPLIARTITLHRG